MLPRGRPPGPGTAEEKAAIRREKVRLNVKAYRERKKKALAAAAEATTADSSTTSPSSSSSESRPSPAHSNSSNASSHTSAGSEDQRDIDEEYGEVVIRRKPLPLPKRQAKNPNASNQWAPAESVWLSPDSGHMFSQAFLSVFRNNFLPSTVSLPTDEQANSFLVTPCSPWITNAYDTAINQDSGALKSGLVAVGLILSGMADDSGKLKMASLQMHRQALYQLRNDLGPITLQRQRQNPARSILVSYLTCLAVAMFEMIQNGFSRAILQHISAMNSLIELMYADPNVDRFTVDLVMEDFGMLEMMFCIKYERASVLRNTRRKLARQRRESGLAGRIDRNATVYGDILDMVDDLPGLIIQVKAFQTQKYSEVLGEQVQKVIRKLFRIQGDLDAWNIRFEVGHGSIMVQESFSDQKSGESGFRPRLRSYEHGAVGLFVYNFLLCALSANIDATTILAQCQQQQQQQQKQSRQLDSLKQLKVENLIQVSTSGIVHVKNISKEGTSGLRKGAGQSEKPFLGEQLKAQRIKVRFVMARLLELMEEYSNNVHNLTGQSLLIGPSDTIRSTLKQEQIRLNKDLSDLKPDDHAGAIEVNKYLAEVAEAADVFKNIESMSQYTGT